jgi:membrane-associated phospholipid phosphatase
MAVAPKLAPLDRVTLGYVAAVELALVYLALDGNAPYWPWMAAAHALLGICALIAPYARHAGRLGGFLGDWYTMLLIPALYGAIGIINLEEARAYDHVVQRLEQVVFGSQVSYRWIREFPNPAFSWIMHVCYLAYVLILYSSPLALWISGRRDAARRTLFAVVLSFFVCYLAFILFPVAGPRYLFDLAHNAATSVGPARLTQWVLDHGDAWGAAFPSSHVAAAVVATGMAYRSWRRLGLVLAPFTAGLVLSVVYGQFHYGVDALTGLVVAGTVLALVGMRDPDEVPVRVLRRGRAPDTA